MSALKQEVSLMLYVVEVFVRRLQEITPHTLIPIIRQVPYTIELHLLRLLQSLGTFNRSNPSVM